MTKIINGSDAKTGEAFVIQSQLENYVENSEFGNGSVNNLKLSQMGPNTIKANLTDSTSSPTDVSLSNLKTKLEISTDIENAINSISIPAPTPLATEVPLAETGSGSVGTSTKAAREDHVHPAVGGSGSTTPTSIRFTADNVVDNKLKITHGFETREITFSVFDDNSVPVNGLNAIYEDGYFYVIISETVTGTWSLQFNGAGQSMLDIPTGTPTVSPVFWLDASTLSSYAEGHWVLDFSYAYPDKRGSGYPVMDIRKYDYNWYGNGRLVLSPIYREFSGRKSLQFGPTYPGTSWAFISARTYATIQMGSSSDFTLYAVVGLPKPPNSGNPICYSEMGVYIALNTPHGYYNMDCYPKQRNSDSTAYGGSPAQTESSFGGIINSASIYKPFARGTTWVNNSDVYNKFHLVKYKKSGNYITVNFDGVQLNKYLSYSTYNANSQSNYTGDIPQQGLDLTSCNLLNASIPSWAWGDQTGFNNEFATVSDSLINYGGGTCTLEIGSDNSGYGNSEAGKCRGHFMLGEILIFNSAVEDEEFETYLMNKWGV